jgi:integrase
MGRKASPWYWEERAAWYVTIDGQRHRLAPDKDEAERRYHELMANRKKEPRRQRGELLAIEVADRFLEWSAKNRAASTVDWYKDLIQRFFNSSREVARLKVTELKPLHVIQWADSGEWSDTYRRNCLTSVQRAFRWAAKVGLIDQNPLLYIDKPKAGRRENPISPSDFAKILAAIKDEPFRDLIEFAWESGCRPQEARHIEAKHVNLEQFRIDIPPQEAKGKKRWRKIYLSVRAGEIVKRLAAANPKGKLFRNRNGDPWKNYAICCRFARLRKKLNGTWAAYDLRHAFATRKIMDGADPITVAALLGHVDATMLCKHYEHVATNHEHMLKHVR